MDPNMLANPIVDTQVTTTETQSTQQTEQSAQAAVQQEFVPDQEAQIAFLEQKLEYLQSMLDRVTAPQLQQPVVAPEAVIVPDQPINFFEGSKLASTFEAADIAALNEVLQSVYVRAREDAQQKLTQKIPTFVQSSVAAYKSAEDQAARFWKANKDLLQSAKSPEQVTSVQSMVANTANQLAAQNPGWSFDQISNAAAKTVRTALGLEQAQSVKRGAPPAGFPPPGQGVKPQSTAQPQDPIQPYQPNSPEHIQALFKRPVFGKGVTK
jgi:hypothetical protein